MGGSSPAPTVQESMASILSAYLQHMPSLIQTTTPVSIAANEHFERSKLGLAKELSPQYAALQSYLYGKYAPQLARVGSDIDRYAKIQSAQTDADILAGPGQRLALTAKEIDKLLNPQFYNVRELQGNKYDELLNSINIDSPNIEAERLLNAENVRSGNTTPSNTTAIANAISFGNERMKRQNTLSNALAGATNFLQQSKTSFDPFGRSSTTGAGQGQFTGISPVGETGFTSAVGMGNNLLNSATQVRNTEMGINANRRDTLDRFNETMSSLPSVSC